jgi:four helix bundle protein
MENKYDLGERLIDFSSECFDIAELLPKSVAAKHIAGQLARSSSSPSIHYGEAQAAESRADFIHKMKICLKELKETCNTLTLIQKRNWLAGNKVPLAINENKQLIAIFTASINTAQKNEQTKLS